MKSLSISQLRNNIGVLNEGEDITITSHGFVIGYFRSALKEEAQAARIAKNAGLEPPVTFTKPKVAAPPKVVKESIPKPTSEKVSSWGAVQLCPCGVPKSVCKKHMFSKG